MTAREEMLAAIRRAVAAGAGPGDGAAPVPREYCRTSDHAPGSDDVIDLLVDRLVDYRAEVSVVSSDELAMAISAALQGISSVVVPAGLPTEWVDAADAADRMIRVDGEPVLTAAELDGIGAVLTGARVAIALTGTIVLDAGPDQGRRAITLVPDVHVVVLRAEQIVHTVPEGLARLTPTAPLTMISGPSATSDIELQRVEGVHGPRTLRVLIVS